MLFWMIEGHYRMQEWYSMQNGWETLQTAVLYPDVNKSKKRNENNPYPGYIARCKYQSAGIWLAAADYRRGS